MRNYTGYGWEGENYDRSLDIKEIAKKVRAKLKKEYPKCKFSVRVERYAGGQSLHLALMAAPFEVFGEVPTEKPWGMRDADFEGLKEYQERHKESGYAQLNHYTFHRENESLLCNGAVLTRKAWDCLKRAAAIATGYNYDDSDGQIDYFDTNFYLHVNIGRWDKPFVKN